MSLQHNDDYGWNATLSVVDTPKKPPIDVIGHVTVNLGLGSGRGSDRGGSGKGGVFLLLESAHGARMDMSTESKLMMS